MRASCTLEIVISTIAMASLKDIKLASYVWDADKNPSGFSKFVDQWSSIVRAIHGGDELESFLDRKLERSRASNALIPSWLARDPELAAPGHGPASIAGDRPAVAAGVPAATRQTGAQPADSAIPGADGASEAPETPLGEDSESYASAAGLINPGSMATHGSNFRLKETGVYYASLPDRQLYLGLNKGN